MRHARSVSYHDELMKALRGPAERAEYVNAAMEDGDPKVLLKALRNVAEATGGMQHLARKAKLSRESLYKMLSPRGNPELSSLERVLRSLGLGLRVEPQKARVSCSVKRLA